MNEEALSLEALLISRAYLYEVFHKAFGGTPSAELFDVLTYEQTIAVADEYADAGKAMADLTVFLKELGRCSEEEGYLEAIKDEYTRLFVGPGRLPVLPWESPYVTKEPVFFQKNTLTVRKAYHAHGYRAKKEIHVPDDHVSLLCSFVAALSRESLGAFRGQQYGAFRIQMLDQKNFVESHLCTWLPQFAESMQLADRTGYFATLAGGAAAFCSLDGVFTGEAAAWIGERDSAADTTDDGSDSAYERGRFQQVEEALEKLKALPLQGIEDNEIQRAD